MNVVKHTDSFVQRLLHITESLFQFLSDTTCSSTSPASLWVWSSLSTGAWKWSTCHTWSGIEDCRKLIRTQTTFESNHSKRQGIVDGDLHCGQGRLELCGPSRLSAFEVIVRGALPLPLPTPSGGVREPGVGVIYGDQYGEGGRFWICWLVISFSRRPCLH